VLHDIAKMSFEDALEELEEIGHELEQGKGKLDDAIRSYERGAALKRHCESLGVEAVLAKPFSEGGKGCTELASIVRDLAAASEPKFTPLYDWNAPIEQKIATVAREMYGAHAVDYTARARRDLVHLEKIGFGKLPVCIAKTQQSLSDNPALLGRPKDFLVTVREIQLAAGAGFVIPITGEIMRMPGLPKEPMAHKFDLTDDGEITFSR
jgi:formate--tetrahydrofolate ligase